MDDQKIRISWDDVQSTRVDEQIARQAALERSARQAQHFVSRPPPTAAPAVPASPSLPSFFYNSLVYLALFGGGGGLFGWIGGEIVTAILPDYRREALFVGQEEGAILALAKSGQISNAQAQKRRDDLYHKHRKNPYVENLTNKSLSDAEKARQFTRMMERDAVRMSVHSFLYFSLIAVVFAFFLTIGDPIICRNWLGAMVNGSVALALGLLGGCVVGLSADRIYHFLGGGGASPSLGVQIIARALSWSLLGGFVAIAPGIILRNGKRFLIGLAGGSLGGLLGGFLFDPLIILTQSVSISRFVAVTAIGILMGVGTGFLENSLKSGWLKVVAGLIAGKQFVLYRNPTIIGSSPQCEIYLFKDPLVGPRHAAIHVGRGFEIEALPGSGETLVNGQAVSRARLREGDQIQIGSTLFSFQGK